MGIKFKNNARSVLATTISDSSVTLSVYPGDGAMFPSLGMGDFFYATLFIEDGTNEIVKVTARSGDTFTIERGQDGTSAVSWLSTTTRIECRVNAANIEYIAGVAEDAATDAASAVSAAGAATITANAAASAASNAVSDSASAVASANNAVDLAEQATSGWIEQSETIVSSTTSTIVVSGNKTGNYLTGRAIRVNTSGSQTGRVTSSSYSAPNTTINIEGFTVSSPTGIELSKVYAVELLPKGNIPGSSSAGMAMLNAANLQAQISLLSAGLTHVRAKRTGSQSIPNATNTTLVFNNELEDTLGEYNAATGVFTAANAGTYLISFLVVSDSVTWGSSEYWRSIVIANSVEVASDTQISGAVTASYVTKLYSVPVYLEAGQTAFIRAYQTQGGAVGFEQGAFFEASSLTITRIP